MSNLTVPLNFGERQCDRMLLHELRSSGSSPEMKCLVRWMAFLVWKDFGIARDDRRSVPVDSVSRAICPAVIIIEQYIGWEGKPGQFVEAAIAAGFFQLVPLDASSAELVLVDFFPANHSHARDITNSKLGGVNKGVNIALRHAETATAEQLTLFQKTRSTLLDAHSKPDLKAALLLIHQICKVLKRPAPIAEEWQEALTVKALDVKKRHGEAAIQDTLRWFVANRDSQEVQSRLDFILDRFDEFAAKGKRDFG